MRIARDLMKGLVAAMLALAALVASPVSADTAEPLDALEWLSEQRPLAAVKEARRRPRPQDLDDIVLHTRVALVANDREYANTLAATQPEPIRVALQLWVAEGFREANATPARLTQVLAPLRPRCLPQRQPDCAARLVGTLLRLEAQQQARSGQIRAAQQTLRQALPLLPLLPRLAAGGELAVLLQQADDSPAADAQIAQMLQWASDRPALLAVALIQQSFVRRQRNDLAGQRQALEQALQLTLAAEAPGTLAVARANLVEVYAHTNQPKLAKEQAEAVLADPEQLLDRSFNASLLHNLALSLIELRQFDAARQRLAQIESLRLAPNGPRERAEVLRELSRAWGRAGQYREALRLFHQERQLDEQAERQENQAAMADLQSQGAALQQQAELDQLRQQEALQQRTLRNQATLRAIWLTGGVVVVVAVLCALLLWLGSRVRHKRLQRSQRQLHELSDRDSLTGLLNRGAMQRRLVELTQAGVDAGLLLLDLDHFKQINDAQGHAAGDAVLQAVAERLRSQLREGDLLSRWGGEEFLVLAPRLPSVPLRRLAHRVVRAVGQHPISLPNGKTMTVTASVGFASFPLPPDRPAFSWERAVHWVDLALYQAKRSGRNRAIGVLSASLPDDEALRRIELDFVGAVQAARVQLVQLHGEEALS